MATKHSRSRTAPQASGDLQPLFEFSRIVNASLDVDFVLSTLLLTAMGKMLVSRGIVLTRRDRTTFRVVAVKGLPTELNGTEIKIPKAARGVLKLSSKRAATAPWLDFFISRGMAVLMPIKSDRSVMGYLALGDRPQQRTYAKHELTLLHSLLNLSGSALEKALMVEELKGAKRHIDHRYQELNTLFDLGKEFNRVLEPDQVVRLLTFSLLGQVGVNRYAVCLRSEAKMEIATSRLDTPIDFETIADELCRIRTPMLLKEPDRRGQLKEHGAYLLGKGICALVPMIIQDETKGMILLGERARGTAFEPHDLEFLASLGNLASISIENARLFKEALEKQRMEEDLKIAREIQQGLLPLQLPEIPGWDLAAVNLPSRQVGGDYYDVIPLGNERFVVAIGDVSGKGTPAALLMSSVQASLRALAPLGDSLPSTTARINNLISRNTGGDKFITLIWGILDARDHVFRYVNAGHNHPFLLRAAGGIERLASGGLILGMMPDVGPYEEGEVRIDAGDTLYFFTDGVSEAMNPDLEDFTEERLEALLCTLAGARAADVIASVERAVSEHAAGAPQADDLTMLVVRRFR